MIIANSLGYEASAESIITLQQLLTALNALPAAWADKTPVNAVLVGEDVMMPQLSPDDFVLWPDDVWTGTESAWRDVSITVDGGEVRSFALDAPSINEAKERVIALLNDYQAGNYVPTEPIFETPPTPPTPVKPPLVEPPPADPTPVEPTPAEPTPVEPTPTETSTEMPVQASVTSPMKLSIGTWALLGIVGLGAITAVIIGTGKKKRKRFGNTEPTCTELYRVYQRKCARR